MSGRTLLVVAVLAAQALALAYLYRGCRSEDTGMLRRLVETRQSAQDAQTAKVLEEKDGTRKNLLQKYVLDPRANVMALRQAPDYSGLARDARRIKLIEYFSLHVADADFSLLPEEEQKMLMREFLRRYDQEQ